MSRGHLPKQLIPFIGGKSLLQLAYERLEGLVPPERVWICAGRQHRDAILRALPRVSPEHFLGEPEGRDTVNAVGFGAAVLQREDPEAVVAVFTADHRIEPVHTFREIVRAGYDVAEQVERGLVTFGITPTEPSTAYGYLELGRALDGGGAFTQSAREVTKFHEKPDRKTAEKYLSAGAERFLWNSGMFVWRAATLMECLRRYEPANHEGLETIAAAWGSPRRDEVVTEVYPLLKKISVDYAVMEPASGDPDIRVAAVPMPLEWLDVGSWPSFKAICRSDERGNRLGGGLHLLHESSDTLVASSDPEHLIAAVGCRDLLIIHTPDATLVCRADDAEAIKEVHGLVRERFGEGRV
jgi:mannose-1-phosphate guanylyltransferase